MSQSRKIAVAHGDGIGPEIMDATLRILQKAGARIEPIQIEIGEKVYNKGHTAGITDEAWDVITSTGVFLKAPITTPQGGGFKSLNVTVRKTLGLYSNVRPCRSFAPFVKTKHPGMDIVIIRENEEDLYAGIEHRQTDEVYQCLKIITRPGTERIVRYAFEFAKRNGRKKITCMTKDNIMKMTDGLFHKIFDEIGQEYPEIEKEHWIIDIGAAKIANNPQTFDVILLPNLYGDIMSDVAAEIAGSVGMAGSANIGEHCAMFEAIHGSAPRRAGQNLANPSGLLNGAIQMLVHIGQPEVAEKIQNAWLKTIEDGIHTYDIFSDSSKKKVGTKEFADAIIERLGQKPSQIPTKSFSKEKQELKIELKKHKKAKKTLVGIDVFIHETSKNANQIAEILSKISGPLKLEMITNRGVKVWPKGHPQTFCTDHWRCRFMGSGIKNTDLVHLLSQVESLGVDSIKTENLYEFDGVKGFSLGQGQ